MEIVRRNREETGFLVQRFDKITAYRYDNFGQ